ncbi:MAG: hypothetical protein ACYTGL_19280 [Planctomycetota bacterium]|jgi:hypothetical protein
MTTGQAVENAFVESLATQLEASAAQAKHVAVMSSNLRLDVNAVALLQDASVLTLHSENEALSKTLEAGPLAEAIVWAVKEAAITRLTLIGHSRAAAVEGSEQAPNLVARARLHNERLAASKLKLKDDVARVLSNSQVASLICDGGLKVDALFYLQESDTFLAYDHEAEEFSAA